MTKSTSSSANRMIVAGGVVLCALTFAAGEASATIYCHQERVDPVITGCGFVQVRHSLNCVNPGDVPVRVDVKFCGECTVAAFNDTTWLNVDILVNGIAIPPTNDDNAFCTNTADNQLDDWVSACADGLALLRPGNNSVVVRGNLPVCAAGNTFRLDDSSVVVFN